MSKSINKALERCKEIWQKNQGYPNRILNGQSNKDYNYIHRLRKRLTSDKNAKLNSALMQEEFYETFFGSEKPSLSKSLKNVREKCNEIWEKYDKKMPPARLACGNRNQDYQFIANLRYARSGSSNRRWFPELLNEEYANSYFYEDLDEKIKQGYVNRCQVIWDKYGRMPKEGVSEEETKALTFIRYLRAHRAGTSGKQWHAELLSHPFSLEFFGPKKNKAITNKAQVIERFKKIFEKYKKLPPAILEDGKQNPDRSFINRYRHAARCGEASGRLWFNELFNQPFSEEFFPQKKFNSKQAIKARELRRYERDHIFCQDIYARGEGMPQKWISGRINPDFEAILDIRRRLKKIPSAMIEKSDYAKDLIFSEIQEVNEERTA